MRKKIKKIQFINTETNEKEIIEFSSQNNIIIGPKGGGKSKLLNILAAVILENNSNDYIEIPSETVNIFKKHKLKLDYIDFYDNKQFSENKIKSYNYNDNLTNSQKKEKDEVIKEEKELLMLINNKRNIILQDDNVKKDIFYDNDCYKNQYLNHLIENNANLQTVFNLFESISDQISKLSKINFLKDEYANSIEWHNIEHISMNIKNNDELNEILSSLNMRDFTNSINKINELLTLELVTLINSEEVDKLKEILKSFQDSNNILLKILKKEESEAINNKIKLLEKLNTEIKDLKRGIYNKAFLLKRIIEKFSYSFTKMEEKAKNNSDKNKSNWFSKDKYEKDSKNLFNNIADILFNIKFNIYKYKIMMDNFNIDEIKISQLIDRCDKKENSFLVDSDIKLELNINSNIKLEVQKFILKEILSLKDLEDNNITSIIRSFLIKKEKGKGKGNYNNSFRTYKKIEKEAIHTKFNQEYLGHVRFMVKDIETSEFKSYNHLSLGQKSIYGINLSIKKFSDDVIFIDQPEDNLDNQTISKHIINKLKKRNKNNLQTFIVTHNANIGILSNDFNTNCSVIMADINEKEKKYFSIMNPWNEQCINDQAINYLEGSKQNLEERVRRILKEKK